MRAKDGPGAWRWPVVRARGALTLLALVLAIALVQGLTVRAALLAKGSELPAYAPFVWHISGALGVWFALPAVQCAVLNAPDARAGWSRSLLVHLACFAAFASIQLSTMFGLRALLRHFLGVEVEQQPLGYQILWDAQNDVVIYAGLAALLGTFSAWAERNREALRASQLQSRLTAARLEALTLQLDPHFLYNSLNSLSAIMYEDLAKAERLTANLGQLLRATLDFREPTWSLADELAHAARYVELLQARFEERLQLEWRVDQALAGASVPRLCIQTLIENALKHNRDRSQALHITVEVRRAEGALQLEVSDDGRGFDASVALDPNHGLGRLNEMLLLLHGAGAGVQASRSEQGGARVCLRLRSRAE